MVVQSSEVVYKDDTADPIKGDQNACLKVCSVVLPKGARAYCYANEDSENPNADQFCGYEKDGFMYGADGCCARPCPGEECPDEPPRPPEKVQSRTTKSTKTKKPEPKPLPRLVVVMLLILAVLLVLAGIFVSVGI